MKRSPIRGFFTGVAAAASFGCVGFSAPVERSVSLGEFAARVQKVSGRKNQEVRVALVVERVPPESKLLRASIRTELESFCSGPQATLLSRTAAPSANDPLRAGERIVLEFGVAAMLPLTGSAPRLDLLLESARGTRRCIPLELTEGQARLTWDYDQRITFGADFSFEGYPGDLAPVSYLGSFLGTAGIWLGRYRLELAAGIGGAGCPSDYCVPDKDTETNESMVFPFHAGVHTPLLEISQVALGVTTRYRAVKLAADTRNGRESFWAHGPVLAPYAAVVGPDSLGMPFAGSKAGLLGFEFPLGYAFGANGERSLSIGFSVRAFFTVL